MTAPASWTGDEDFAYLTTRGRRTGRNHTIEIWFGLEGRTAYMLAGGGRRADWVRNLIDEPAVSLRIADVTVAAQARLVSEATEESLARELLAGKYQGWQPGGRMSEWARTALPVAVDV
jgi:deazaflavin-dependent oxidoreductase (nitroreductase family)